MEAATVESRVFQDGENSSPEREAIEVAMLAIWNKHYGAAASLKMIPGCVNLKQQPDAATALPKLREIYVVRNPDIYFVATLGGRIAELGGVEITTHSPDGSNVDKRYPFLWAAGQWPVHAFVATPYMKQRPNGQQNCLPHRHALRNKRFAEHWNPSNPAQSTLRQILPIRELQVGEGRRLPVNVADALFSWADLGGFFAHVAAAKLLGGEHHNVAVRELKVFKGRLTSLVAACLANTTDTEPSSLIMQPKKWVQVYNTRPETGHWERGEGQFDSIDGRLMFTADEIAEMKPESRPSLEFWMPQMTSAHPWIAEQRQRNYRSKRLRNILVVLRPFCTTKFADELSPRDWAFLRANPQLLLERLDWPPALYRFRDLVSHRSVEEIARRGLVAVEGTLLAQMKRNLLDANLYYASYRPYAADWQNLFTEAAQNLSRDVRVLAPRIPRSMLSPVAQNLKCTCVPAESCTRSELMSIRQLDRNRHVVVRARL